VLLYPKTLGGCVVFSGSVPLTKSFAEKVSPQSRKVKPTVELSVCRKFQKCILDLNDESLDNVQTPVLWFHGMADGLVLFEAGHAGCAFLEELGMSCEFKVETKHMRSRCPSSVLLHSFTSQQVGCVNLLTSIFFFSFANRITRLILPLGIQY
jgi:hypothetical protein